MFLVRESNTSPGDYVLSVLHQVSFKSFSNLKTELCFPTFETVTVISPVYLYTEQKPIEVTLWIDLTSVTVLK